MANENPASSIKIEDLVNELEESFEQLDKRNNPDIGASLQELDVALGAASSLLLTFMKSSINSVVEDDEFLDAQVQLYRKVYDEFLRQGFTKEDAVRFTEHLCGNIQDQMSTHIESMMQMGIAGQQNGGLQ